MEKLKQMDCKIKIPFFIIIIFISSLTYSQDIQFGGYSKYLISISNIKNINEQLIDHYIHSRINLKWFINDNINISAGLRDRIIIGGSINKIPDYEKNFNQNEYLLKLSSFIWKSRNSINYFEIDRLWIDYYYKKIQLSIGRQRIAWGTSWVWNITDLFNPLSILDFDYEERPAVDALRIQFFTSEISKIEFAFKPWKNFDLPNGFGNSTIAFQFYFNKYEYDFYLLAGYHNERPILGFSWAGDIYGAGFRGEVSLTSSPSNLYDKSKKRTDSSNYYEKEKRSQLSFVLSFDYTFTNSFYIHTEMLYNNIGKTDSLFLFTNEAKNIGMLSPSKLNLFYQAGYNLSPLSRIDIIALHNPYDKSYAILPLFTYSLSQNLDLSFIILYLHGKDLSEYSPESKMIFARLKYSF